MQSRLNCKQILCGTSYFVNRNRLSGRPRVVRLSLLSVKKYLRSGRQQRSLWLGVRNQAVAAPEAHPKFVFDEELQITRDNTVQVQVKVGGDDSQCIVLKTDMEAGRLLLHWGVEGGPDYMGGWRLPPASCRPQGTIQYKNRALQTPFVADSVGGGLRLQLDLPSEESSDCLNFVLKDSATNTWYDCSGSNFRVPLRALALESLDAVGELDIQVVQPPQELCGIWSYIKWEDAGCPQRSQQDADREYQMSINEVEDLLKKGRPLEELWKVAKGDIRYADYAKEHIQGKTTTVQPQAKAPPPPPPPSPPPQPAPAVVEIPQDLINTQAYLLWERAGKPDGADFGKAAREQLQQMIQQGKTVEKIRKELLKPQDGVKLPPSPARGYGSPVVGESLGTPVRDPLQMVKRDELPQLSEEKHIPERERPLEFLVQSAATSDATLWRRIYPLGDKSELLVVVSADTDSTSITVDNGTRPDVNVPLTVTVTTDDPNPMVVHWGVTKPKKGREWMSPPDILFPANSEETAGVAVETQMYDCEDEECDVEIIESRVPLQRVKFHVPQDHGLSGLAFVLKSLDGSKWWKSGDGDFFIPLPGEKVVEEDREDALAEFKDEMTRTLVQAEVYTHQWTLMHRFNKAAELVDGIINGYFTDISKEDAMATIYVWLRYSVTRHLTWQRNYNTQPRILSAAQQRLTHALARAHAALSGQAQEWARQSLGTVGGGGDGQRIRDEILQIMHRNHIGEKRELWIEQWHQKLHNNTTADDVDICAAYIAYLEGNGDMGAYWRTLSDAGITRERLESFDRAITAEPAMYGVNPGTLISEFRNYLGILKAVHKGDDIQQSAKAVYNWLPDGAKSYVGYVVSHLNDNQILPLLEAAVEARIQIQNVLRGNRELLYLDLALENQVRQAAERGTGAVGLGAAAFLTPILQNLILSTGDNEEICYCLKAWQSLPVSVRRGGRPTKEEALQGKAVVDRTRRALSELSDNIVQCIGPISLKLGRAFGVEDWAVQLFAEEVVRGGPAFSASLVLSSIDPPLRAAAELGAWQIISPINAVGRIVCVPDLGEVQDLVFDEPTVLIAGNVSGEEEIPDGAVGVISQELPDVLSHVSVRARNMKALFAACYEEDALQQLTQAEGKVTQFNVTAAGQVTWEIADESEMYQPEATMEMDSARGLLRQKSRRLRIDIPEWCGLWVVNMNQFGDGIVGAKSKNLAALRGQIPDWISLPPSVTLPFGTYEEVLDKKENKKINTELKAVLKDVSKGPSQYLPKCRELVMQLHVPEQVQTALQRCMKEAGIPIPESKERWEMAFEAIKGVWASQYNERAFFSMRKVGLSLRQLRMAVLVQRVVPAQYAFVIHTRNPSTGDENEIYCELVQGLGESLVSGMVPGSSLAFVAKRDDLDNPQVLSYPSKSEAMFVRESLIFRSDSNGEDLPGYAGAGLYESITMDPTQLEKVDFSSDKLNTNEQYRRSILSRICQVGNAIHEAFGIAQDVEGVVDLQGEITVVQTRPQV